MTADQSGRKHGLIVIALQINKGNFRKLLSDNNYLDKSLVTNIINNSAYPEIHCKDSVRVAVFIFNYMYGRKHI